MFFNFNGLMKKTLVFGGLIAAMVLAFSCNKEQTIEEPVLHEYTFAVSNGDSAVNTADTKSVLGSDEKGLFLQWESTDKLNTWASVSEGKYSYNNESTIDASTSPVTFKIKSYQLLSAGATAYASYPYASNSNKTPIALLSFPTAQNQNGETFVANAMPMVSKPFPISNAIEQKNGISDETTAVAFYNLGGIIEFDIYSPTGTYAEENIKSVKFEAASKIAGSFEFDLTSVDPSDASTLSIADEDYAETAVTTTVSGTLAVGSANKASNAKKVYMAVAPGSYTGTVTVITSGATYVYPVSAAKTIERSAVKRLGINLEKEGVRQETIDYVTLDWDYAGGTAADLNAVVGVTTSGLGTDYKEEDHAPYQVKFDGTGDYIQIKTDAAIGTVSVGYKMVGGNITSHLNIFESTDGNNWGTRIDRLEISGAQNSTGTVTTTASFNNASRFVKIVFDKGSNVGIGEISIHKPNTNPVIQASDIANVPASGVTDESWTYIVKNFVDDVEVADVTDCVTEAIADGGSIVYSVSPNYTTTAKNGTIVLWSAADHSVTTTINVAQLRSTLTVSELTVTIPANSTSATFTVTSAEFGYNAVVASTEAGMNLSISNGATGSASASAQTVTVSSTTEAPTSGDPITLGTIHVYRNGNTSDSQLKEIVVKKGVASGTGNDVYYTKVSTITSGKTYLIVDGTHIFNGASVASSTPGVAASITANGILSNSTIDTYAVTITSDGTKYKVLLSTGKYLVINTSTKNSGSLTSNDAGESITISYSNDHFRMISGNLSTRGLCYRAGTVNAFKNYAVSNFGSGEYGGNLDLYEYQGE